jgi:hypothetical protein
MNRPLNVIPPAPDTKIIAAGKIIEAALPAYAELHRAWAKGTREANTFVEANFDPDWRRSSGGNCPHPLRSNQFMPAAAPTWRRRP